MRVARWLTWLLRHGADEAGLVLDEAGWAEVEDVLLAAWEAGVELDENQLAEIVAADDKGRFELAGGQVRAVYGHSLSAVVEVGELATPPSELYHGTVEGFVDRILSRGLRPQGRRYVHLSETRDDAWQVAGRRRGRSVLLAVDAAALHGDGAAFRRSGAGVWLVEHVPPAYLSLYPRAHHR